MINPTASEGTTGSLMKSLALLEEAVTTALLVVPLSNDLSLPATTMQAEIEALMQAAEQEAMPADLQEVLQKALDGKPAFSMANQT